MSLLLRIYHWVFHPFRSLASRVVDLKYPIPGLDFRFLAECKNCDDYTGFTSVRGGEQCQCNTCGDRTSRFHFDAKQLAELRLSSLSFWNSWKMIPYNWHTLPESEKEKFLGRKKKLCG